ncbi:DUF342 domain-containing protein [Robertmurraya yapensis]|uniref:DUF342 domain-containing protein n=2 Tax=Bacillaceae TaxID=186817 RepID=A0A431WK77_9BACI|nr:FapA family protein [Bacillus yapensis]RTR35604.1 DUF342 domain-containing protein [Bacillus yapensis]TKS98405.1 DUF342 domain-containing protein [Bacillus yapensis]
MDTPFRVKISKNQLEAYIELQEQLDEDFTISVGELEAFLKEHQVVFGIIHTKLQEIAIEPSNIEYPFLIAEGIPPQHGEDAYLTVEFKKEETKQKEKVNFREVLDIPSIKSGEVMASAIPQTFGINGTAVTGKVLPAHDGKPLKVKPGKNVIQNGNQFIATIDGEVSITHKAITVNPVFEVRGDLDLKTGNVNFVGNVVIHGNVPTGYEVVAGGDIKVYGLVEGAQLVARGNILISGGIAGGNRGNVVAGGSIQANFLNQAAIRAGQDVIIHTSSLHSNVEAKGAIYCKNGHVIGGTLRSGKDIYVKELGNDLYTKTGLAVGYDPSIDKKELSLKEEAEQISENVKKLELIENKILVSLKQKGQVTEQEKELLLKQRATKTQLEKQLESTLRKLEVIEFEKSDRSNFSIFVYDKVHPNTSLHFGKYSRLVHTTHSYVRFYIRNSEIVFDPI